MVWYRYLDLFFVLFVAFWFGEEMWSRKLGSRFVRVLFLKYELVNMRLVSEGMTFYNMEVMLVYI